MWQRPQRVFILLLILAGLLFWVDLPENYRFRLQLGKLSFEQLLNPPRVNFQILGREIKKDFKTHLGLDLSGGTHLVLEADMREIIPEDRRSALEGAKQVIERRVNFFGLAEPIVQSAITANSYRIVIELPGITDVDRAVSVIGQTARLEFREFTEAAFATEAASPSSLLAVSRPVGLTGKDLKRSQLEFSQQTGEPEVGIEFTPEGGKKFAEETARLVGKPLGIFLDDLLISAPRVNSEITGGNAVITGKFTLEEAKNLVLQLNAGALPVPVSVVEKRTVGATLGATSVAKSLQAGFIGLTLVAIFMIAKYGWLGVIADLALLLYGLLNLAIFRAIPITLTLPGVTGFLLSIGMAVDSNILIFERYKEELRSGKSVNSAMELGFGRAWESIRDANFTTLITCLILFNPGNWQFLPSSGMVRGFAITLFIGVVTSLFTGIIVTRTFIRVLYRPYKRL